jgi:nitrate/nitrite-specific signal transduction histidine kinase
LGWAFRWGTLRGKIITWFLVPTAIILSLVGLFAFFTYRRVTEDLVIERNRDLTRLLANQLAVDLAEYTGQLTVLALTADVYAFRTDPLTQQAVIRSTAERLSDFDGGVLIVDELGQVVAADMRNLAAIGQDWSHLPFFQLASEMPARASMPVVSDILPLGPQNADAVVLAVPAVYAEGGFAGLSAGLFRLSGEPAAGGTSFYGGVLRKLQEAGTDSIYLLDGQGRAIYHSQAAQIGQDLAGQEVVQQALARDVQGLRTRDAQDREIVASFAPVPGTPWTLVTEERWEALISTSQGYSRLLLLLLGLGVLIPALVIALGAGRITQPITELTVAAKQVAGGHFDQVISVRTGDELEELAQQFNRMAAELQASYATLEQRVANRTRELATLNSISAVVSRSLDLEEILHDALERTLEIMAMEVGVAYRLEQDSEHLTLIAQHGLSDRLVQHLRRLPLRDSTAGRAARTGKPDVLRVDDYPEGMLKALLRAEGIQTAISVPLTAKGRLLGAINLGSRDARPATPEELSLLAGIGQQTGVAVENARLYERAEETAVAAERNRLARDLHDAVTQTLFSASLIADVLPRLWDRKPEEALQRLEELRQLTRGALAEMRTLLIELRPAALEEAPLADLLRQLGEATTGRARLPVNLEVEGACALPLGVKVALYRVAQEALNNVFKHANASQVTMVLRCARGRAELVVRDDGRGFDPSLTRHDHLGLGIMRERAQSVGAELTIASAVGQGTQVSAVWSASGH